jgi:competence protein ComEC
MLGIIAQEIGCLALPTIAFGFCVCAILFAFLFLKNQRKLMPSIGFGMATYFLSVSLGMLTFYVHLDCNYNNHYSNQNLSATNTINGIIQSDVKPNARYAKYFLNIQSVNQKNASGRLLLYVAKTANIALPIGTEVELRATTLYPIPKAYNPYQFDYANYLEKQNIWHQVYLQKNDIQVVRLHRNSGYYMERLRNSLRQSFDLHAFDSKTKALIDALLLGQRVALDKETLADYTNAGVIHVLAISGLHISVLYFFLIFILRPLRSFRFGKILELLLVLMVLWLFALLTGLPASVTRAVTLFSFMSVGTYFNRSKSLYNAMAVSALLILVFSPNTLFDIGFQLSYAAVLSIVLLQPFYKIVPVIQNKIVRYFMDMICVSMAAQIGVLPLCLYYFNQFPVLFLLANIVIIPLSSFVLLYGIILLGLNFMVPSVALFLGKPLAFSIQYMNAYIHWIANFKWGVISNISFSGVMVAMLYFLIFSLIYGLYSKKSKAIIYIVISIFLFQWSYLVVKWHENESSECIVFNEKHTLIGIKNKNTVIAYTDLPEVHQGTLQHYLRGTFSDTLQVFPLQNVLSFHQKRILVIDSVGIYKTKLKPSIVILTQNPKINLDRLINVAQPKLIIADKSSYKKNIRAWEATCEKAKITFHAIAEKGFYRLK